MKYNSIHFWLLLSLIIVSNDSIWAHDDDFHEYLYIDSNTYFHCTQEVSTKYKLLSARPDWKHFARMIMVSMMQNWSVSLYQSFSDNDHKWNLHYIIVTNIETKTNDGKRMVNFKIERQEDLSFPSDTGQKIYNIFTNMVTKAKKRRPLDRREIALDGGNDLFTIDSGTNEIHGSSYDPDYGLAARLSILACLLFKYGVLKDDRKECIKEIDEKTKEFYSKKLWKLEGLPDEEYNKLIWKNDVPYRQTTNELYEP